MTDLAGNLLDGEFSGSLPSGDSTPGGDFVCTFDIINPPVTPFDGGCAAGTRGSPLAWVLPLVLLALSLARSRRAAGAPE